MLNLSNALVVFFFSQSLSFMYISICLLNLSDRYIRWCTCACAWMSGVVLRLRVDVGVVVGLLVSPCMGT
jgi:hypothetical protein